MLRLIIISGCLLLVTVCAADEDPTHPRVRQAGVQVGVIPPGPLNAITDVAGVLVGQTTVVHGEKVRTGVTAILPHAGNLFREKVPGAVFVGNAFGKLAGSTQVNELGEIETPIVLTSTLSVPRVADAVIDYMLALPGNEDVQSINPLVGETNDGYLNDIRSRPITRKDVFAAIQNAKTGAVEEGSVGAGTVPLPSAGRAASALPRVNFRLPSADIWLAYWFRPTSAACSPSPALPSERSSVDTRFATNWREPKPRQASSGMIRPTALA
jgi:D-aminopeptidase